MIEYKVGMNLWFQAKERYNLSRFVYVVEIGRKWVKLSNGYKVEKTSTNVDGGNYMSPGTLWPTQEAYQAELARVTAWNDFWFKSGSHYSTPEGVTVEDIEAAKKLLRIP